MTRSPFAVTAAGLLLGAALAAQQPPPPPVPPPPVDPKAPAAAVGPQELTRGPVHEAFGRPLAFDPPPGPVAPKAPPEPIEEVPPDHRPQGEAVAWIPGYWHWDEQARDFLWVSGLWRAVPPGRAWVPGYWTQVADGFQWAPGFWAAEDRQAEYVPPPPQSLEAGPVGAPLADHLWVPGSWVWQENRHLWRPGFWVAAQPDWVWVPAHTQWTPSGHLFTEGYWDYPFDRRGLLFAPAAFGGAAPVAAYAPRLALDARMLIGHLFARAAAPQYYFGDYYAADAVRAGYYPWFALHNTRYGYDPLYAQSAWLYERQNAAWEEQQRQGYWLRRERPELRPPATVAALRALAGRPDAFEQGLLLARPVADLAAVPDYPVQFARIDRDGVKAAERSARDYRKLVQDRAKWEEKQVKEALKGGPVKIRLPDSPAFGPPGQGKGKGKGKGFAAPGRPQVPALAPPPPGVAAPAVLPGPDDVLRPGFDRGKGKGGGPPPSKGKGGGKGKGKG